MQYPNNYFWYYSFILILVISLINNILTHCYNNYCNLAIGGI